jgi:hypothetical protein
MQRGGGVGWREGDIKDASALGEFCGCKLSISFFAVYTSSPGNGGTPITRGQATIELRD